MDITLIFLLVDVVDGMQAITPKEVIDLLFCFILRSVSTKRLDEYEK